MDENKKELASNPQEQEVEVLAPVREDETTKEEKKPVSKKEKGAPKDPEKGRISNLIFTIVQLVLIVVFIVVSIVIIVSPPDTKAFERDEVSVRMQRVMTDSMAPTFKINDTIRGKTLSLKDTDDMKIMSGETVLDLTTVVSFVEFAGNKVKGKDNVEVKDENGNSIPLYTLTTHRIIGYQYKVQGEDSTKTYYYQGTIKSFADFNAEGNKTFVAYITCGDHYNIEAHNYGNMTVRNGEQTGTSVASGRQLYKLEGGQYVKLEYKTMEDLNNDYRIYNFEEVEVNGETICVITDVENDSYLARKGEITKPENIAGIITSEKGNSFIGNVVGWLTDKIWHFIVIIFVPLMLLFGYNIYLVIRIIVEEKQKKAVEEAKKEVLASQEEIKRKAIEEYLASLKEKEAGNKEE